MASWYSKFCDSETIRETCTNTTVIQPRCPLQNDDYLLFAGIAVIVGLLVMSVVLNFLVFSGFIRLSDDQARKRCDCKAKGCVSKEQVSSETRRDDNVNLSSGDSRLIREEICASIEDMRDMLKTDLESGLRAIQQNFEESLRGSLMKQSDELQKSVMMLQSDLCLPQENREARQDQWS